MNIEKLKELIISEINPDGFIKIGEKAIIYDYIFLCSLLGNDFIKNILSLNIRLNGLDHLMTTYKKIQDKYSGAFQIINVEYEINNKYESIIKRDNLLVLLTELLDTEPERLKEMKTIRGKQFFKYRGNMRFKRSKNPEEYEKYQRNIPLLENTMEKWIDSPEIDWENRFYIGNILREKTINEHYINHVTYKKREIAEKYIESLYWVALYYFTGQVVWDWYYPANYPALLIDIVELLRDPVHKIELLKNDKSLKPYNSHAQLLIVFPPQSHYLIPIPNLDKKIKENYKTYMFPREFQMDYTYKRYWWEAHPILPEFEETFLNNLNINK